MHQAVRAQKGSEARRLVNEAVRAGLRRIDDGREYTLYQMVQLTAEVPDASEATLSGAVAKPNAKMGVARPFRMKRYRCKNQECKYEGYLPKGFEFCPRCGGTMESMRDKAAMVWSGSRKALIKAGKAARAGGPALKKAASLMWKRVTGRR